jgi:hypothetical protein
LKWDKNNIFSLFEESCVCKELMAKMTSAKFEIEKFNGKNNFELWKLKMRDLLVQQGLHKALDGKRKKPASMTNEEWEDLDARALSTIQLCLVRMMMSCLTLLEKKRG